MKNSLESIETSIEIIHKLFMSLSKHKPNINLRLEKSLSHRLNAIPTASALILL